MILAIPNEYLTLLAQSEESDPRPRAFRNKEMLEGLAEHELLKRLGQKYTDMVLCCLRCLDNGRKLALPLLLGFRVSWTRMDWVSASVLLKRF
jgi:hypothetical protein